MGKRNCNFVYLDHYGNPSQVYATALKKYGKEKAEAIYVKHMLSNSKVRLRKGAVKNKIDYVKVLDTISNAVSSPTDKGYRIKGNVFQRVTDWISGLNTQADHFNLQGMIGAIFKAQESEKDKKLTKEEKEKKKLLEYADKHIPKYVKKNKRNDTLFNIEAGESVEQYIERLQHPKGKINVKERTRVLNSILEQWSYSQKYGTLMHDLIENVLTLVQEARDEDPLGFHDMMSVVQSVIPGVLSTAINSGEYEDLRTVSTAEMTSIMRPIIKKIEDVEIAMGLDKGELVIRPEQPIYSNDLGLAGTIDLLLVNPRNGIVKVLDIKTKTEDSIQTFYSLQEEIIGGPFQGVPNNAANKAGAQMSVYAAGLEDSGFTISGSNEVILIQGNLFKTEEGQWIYSNVKHSGFEAQTNMSTGVREFIAPGDYMKKVEARRQSGIEPIIYNWTGNQVEAISDNSEYYIRDRKLDIHEDIDNPGNYWYLDKNPTSATNGQRRTISAADYNNEKVLDRLFKEEYKHIKLRNNALPGNIVSYFTSNKTANIKRIGDKQIVIDELLQDLEGYTLELAEHAYPDILGDIGPDVLVATKGNEMILISINSTTKKPLKFDAKIVDNGKKVGLKNGKFDATNLYGKYLADADIQSNPAFDASMGNPATTHDAMMLKLAVAGMRLKSRNKNLKIRGLKVASIVGKEKKAITVSNMENEIPKLQKFREIIPPSEFPAEISDMLGNHTLNSGILYGADAVDQLIDILNSSNFRQGSIISSFMSNSPTEAMDMLKKLRQRRRGVIVDEELLTQIRKLLHNIANRPKSPQQLEDYTLVSHVLLAMYGFEHKMDDFLGKELSAFSSIHSAATIGNSAIQQVERIRRDHVSRIGIEQREFEEEHTKHLSAMFREAKVNMATGIGMEEAFYRMIRAPKINSDGKFEEKNPDLLMMLKDPDDPTLKDFPAARAYIKFFAATIERIFTDTTSSDINKERLTEIFKKFSGIIPIIQRKRTINTKEGVKKFLSTTLDTFIPEPFKQVDGEISDETEYKMYRSRYEAEIVDMGQQFSPKRRQALGIEGNGVVPPYQMETNLAVVLTTVVNDTLKKKHLGAVNDAFTAIGVSIDYITRTHPGVQTGATKEVLRKLNLMLIHEQHEHEGKAGEIIDRIGKAASTIIFTASMRQAFIEFSTAWIQGTSSMLSNSINKYLFKTKDEYIWFTPKDWGSASIIWKGSEKAEVMAEENSMTHVDAEHLTSPEYTQHDPVRAFKTKAMWGLNTWSIDNILIHTFTAYAMHKGFWKAYIKDSDNKYRYHEDLDPRYYVYDPALGIGESKPPETEAEHKRHLLWKTNRADLKAEGNLYKEGPRKEQMKIPLTAKEKAMIKQYGTRLFGSMSSDAVIIFDWYSLSRAMTRYKKWFTQKFNNYWTPRGKSYTYLSTEYIEGADFHSLTIRDLPVVTAEDIKEGASIITISKDVPLAVKDKLKFGTSTIEYTIEKIDGDKVTISPVAGEAYPINSTIYVKNAHGYHRTKVEDFEGIIQSIGTATQALRRGGFKNLKTLGRIQRENLSKLFSDLIMLLIMGQLLKLAIESEDPGFFQTPLGETMTSALTNATGELNIGITAYGMTDNIFPAISTFGSITSNLWKAGGAALEGDTDRILERGYSAVKTAGIVRTIGEPIQSIKQLNE